ncbi:MAG: glutamate--tRNA ligase family protein [Candidatus Pacearchaeota archaeon]
MENLNKKTKAYALKNAIAYEGKAKTGSVISSLFNEGLKKEEVKKYSKIINGIISEVNSLSKEEQEKEFAKLDDEVSHRKVREGLPELPNVGKKGVVMRFAPSASGPLHVGHIMTSGISYLYVKKYGGKFYVRIEDTNPKNIDKNSYKMIEKDSDWLFNKEEEVMIQSYRMEIYYKYLDKLLNKDAVYVCSCNHEEFEKYVNEKKDCPCRKLSSKENKRRWKMMLNKKGFNEGEVVLRFKSLNGGMKNKNPAMRDFPLARINETEHPLQKNKYRVWPLMNLAVAVDDIETKVTHSIRAKDHIDNSKKQKMIYDVLGKKFPWVGFLGRFKFKEFELSTTKMREWIKEKKYSGWDDKDLPTAISLKKQGYKPEAFWKFVEQIGLSENDKVIERREFFFLLDSFNNKKFIK